MYDICSDIKLRMKKPGNQGRTMHPKFKCMWFMIINVKIWMI